MIQVSTSEKDLGFGTIGSKNSPIQNISKIEQNARPVGGGVKEAEHYCTSLIATHKMSSMPQGHKLYINNSESAHSALKGYCSRHFYTWGRSLSDCEARARLISCIFFKTEAQNRFRKL